MVFPLPVCLLQRTSLTRARIPELPNLTTFVNATAADGHFSGCTLVGFVYESEGAFVGLGLRVCCDLLVTLHRFLEFSCSGSSKCMSPALSVRRFLSPSPAGPK